MAVVIFQASLNLSDKLSCHLFKDIFNIPKLLFGCWLPFVLFSVKMIPHCCNNAEDWALGRIHHSIRPVAADYHFLCHLEYLSLFSLFSFLKNSLLSATLPWRLFLMRLQGTRDGSAEGSDASFRSCYMSLLKFQFFRFPEKNTLRFCPSGECIFWAWHFFFPTCSVFQFFRATLHNMIRYASDIFS